MTTDPDERAAIAAEMDRVIGDGHDPIVKARYAFELGWVARGEYDQVALERLRAALEAARIPHLRVDGDPWFSCPEAWREDHQEDDWSGTCFQCDGTPCNHRCSCGADQHNADIAVALAEPSTAREEG